MPTICRPEQACCAEHPVDDAAAFRDGLRQHREPVAEKDEIGDRARGAATTLHRDAELRGADREDVVHAVADHRDVAAAGAERANDPRLHARLDTADDAGALKARCELLVAEAVELGGRYRVCGTREPGPARDGNAPTRTG